MYKFNDKLKIKVISEWPNYITLLCSIIFITIISEKTYLEYLIPLCAFIYFLGVKKGKIRGIEGKEVFALFGIFICIQVVGLLGNTTLYSIKNILTSGSAFLIVYTVLSGRIETQTGYIKLYYFIICIVLFCFTGINAGSKNTIAGNAVFMYMLLIILLAGNEYLRARRKKIKKNSIKGYRLIAGMLPAVFFSFLYSARTALFASIFFVFFYFCFYFLDFRAKTYQKLFGVMVVFLIIGLTFYINIRNYSWYPAVNEISFRYFGKNIDSARSYLWRTSLAELKGLNWIWGLGTGTTPFIPRYFNSSFHNSFIQTIMQNGIIGLLCLIFIFWIFWKYIVQIKDHSLRALFISAFIAIVAYNCMECCLLQNKSFLGMIQWIILALGVHYTQVK